MDQEERKAVNWHRLHYKYSHVGCPGFHMEDNCPHPDRCADNGCCLIVAAQRLEDA